MKGLVELEFGHFGVEREYNGFGENEILVDDEGREIPVQLVQSQSTTIWRQRLAFVADLPSLGYRTYHVVPRASEAVVASFLVAEATDLYLDNGIIRVELDEQTGAIGRLYDIRTGYEALTGPAGRAVIIDDPSDSWSHDLIKYDREIGEFRPVRSKLIEHGPVRSIIRVESVYNESRLTQDFVLYQGIDRIEVRAKVDWREKFCVLKLRFPLNVRAQETVYEIPYGILARPNDGREYPGLRWCDQSGEADGVSGIHGVSLLNDCKYAYDAQDHTVSLTILRSPIIAYDRSQKLDENMDYEYSDQGIHRFSYALVPHKGSWDEAQTPHLAAEFNQSPLTVIESYHEGPLPQNTSFVEVDSTSVDLVSLKQAEDSADLIVRCRETFGRADQARIRLKLWEREITAAFGPYEIKTFRVPADQSLPVLETDFLEGAL